MKDVCANNTKTDQTVICLFQFSAKHGKAKIRVV